MKRIFYFIISTFLVLFAYPLLADEDEFSELNNPAQVQKAENLANASQEAAQEDVSEANENVTTAEDNLAEAEAALANLPDTATDDEILAAEQDVLDATTALDEAKEGLAEVSGASVEDINDMRSDGMGWGDIAHALGIHPSVLGLGHGKKGTIERDAESFSTASASTKSNKGGKKSFGLTGKSTSTSKGNNGNSFGKGNSSNKGNSSGKGNGKNK